MLARALALLSGLLAASSLGPAGAQPPAPRARIALSAAARDATLVVRGEVRAVEARRVDAGRRIVSVVTLRVEATYRGPASPVVRLVLPGGRLGDLAQRSGGVPLVEEGDRLLLFLRPRFGALPAGAAPYAPARLGLSVWRVVDGEAVLGSDALRLQTLPGADPDAGSVRAPLRAIEAWLDAPLEGARR